MQAPALIASPQPVTNVLDNENIAQLILEGQRQQHELIDLIRLLNTQLVSFDGDVLKYWSFIWSFDNVIETSKLDDNAKLVRLVQVCTKGARKVVETCLIMDGCTGYSRAHKLLKERFGNEYKIAQAWISKIVICRVVKPNERKKLQEFADDLPCYYDTLYSMGQLAEMNSQSTSYKIVEKLPIYLQSGFK